MCAKLNAKLITNTLEGHCYSDAGHRLTLRSVAFHFKQVRVCRVCSTTFLDDPNGLLVQRNVPYLASLRLLDHDATLQSFIVGDRQ
ncbi:hypothetical protein D3C81_2078480 [compost metagenome]